MENLLSTNFSGTFDSNSYFVATHVYKGENIFNDSIYAYEFEIDQDVPDLELCEDLFSCAGYRGRLGKSFKLKLSQIYDSPDRALEFILINNDPGFIQFLSLCITKLKLYYDEDGTSIIIEQQTLQPPYDNNNEIVSMESFVKKFKKINRNNTSSRRYKLNVIRQIEGNRRPSNAIYTQISSDYYNRTTKREKNERKIQEINRETINDNINLNNIHAKLSQAERNVVQLQGRNAFLSLYLSQIKIIGNYQNFILSTAKNLRIPANEFTIYCQKKRFYSNLKAYVSYLINERNPKIIFITGDKCRYSSSKGYISLPHIDIIYQLSLTYLTFSIDEYRTSTYCICGTPVTLNAENRTVQCRNRRCNKFNEDTDKDLFSASIMKDLTIDYLKHPENSDTLFRRNANENQA